MTCPDGDTLVQCFAGHLVDEEASRVRAHAATCPSCQAELASLQRLTQPLGTDEGLPPSRLSVDDVVAHALAADVPRTRQSRQPWLLALAAAVVVLAGVTLVVRGRGADDDGTFTARGAPTPWKERVSARIVAPTGLVEPGAHLGADTRFTVAAFGVSKSDALQVLAFLVDAKGEVHWVAPQWLDEAQVPPAVKLSRDGGVFAEAPGGAVLGLESSVAFDDLPVGPAVLMTVVAEQAPSVLTIERLPARTEAAVKEKVPRGLVRAVPVVIEAPAPGANP